MPAIKRPRHAVAEKNSIASTERVIPVVALSSRGYTTPRKKLIHIVPFHAVLESTKTADQEQVSDGSKGIVSTCSSEDDCGADSNETFAQVPEKYIQDIFYYLRLREGITHCMAISTPLFVSKRREVVDCLVRNSSSFSFKC